MDAMFDEDLEQLEDSYCEVKAHEEMPLVFREPAGDDLYPSLFDELAQ